MTFKAKFSISLNARLTLLILLMSLGMAIVLIFTGYNIYWVNTENRSIDQGRRTVIAAAALLSGEEAESYLATLRPDARYHELMKTLQVLLESGDINSLYIIRYVPGGSSIIFDADTESSLPLGRLDPWDRNFPEEDKAFFLEGGEIPPRIYDTDLAGQVLTIHSPLRYRDGRIAPGFYAGADFSVESLRREWRQYFWNLAFVSIVISMVFAFAHWFIIRRMVIKPVRTMAAAVQEYLAGEAIEGEIRPNISSLAGLSLHTGDDLERLAESLKNMENKTWDFIQSLNEAKRKATIDALTQLHNREAFYNNVSVFLLHNRVPGQIHAFMMMDIDHFKQVNDTFGHSAGDDVLKQCASALSRIFRRSDEVARMGGDEFTIFCPNVGTEELVKQKADQIKEVFFKIKPAPGSSGITTSAGIVMFENEPISYEELFSRADTVLYQVKTGGRNGYKIVNLEH
ncbi:MAG: GGDEF domain-containing protein [Treponema sp.]|jgi:diguanylate cyclase (GGDEF)-like protein|nr:GGDEF domain-containing protein [Treponema sp.]